MSAAFEAWRSAAVAATRALGKSVWALGFLVFAAVVMIVAGMIFGPLGIAGGFVLGFIQAWLIGWYLSLLELGVVQRRRISLSDIQARANGVYLWDVFGVLFPFFIAQMVLDPTRTGNIAVQLFVLIASLLFNPAPEQIYQDHTTSLPLFQDAMQFMQRAWAEWLGIQAPFIVLIAVLIGGTTDAINVLTLLEVLQLYGPFFGFVNVGLYATGQALGGPVGILLAFALLGVSHWLLLMRGFLYGEFKTGRRAREWRRRMGQR